MESTDSVIHSTTPAINSPALSVSRARRHLQGRAQNTRCRCAPAWGSVRKAEWGSRLRTGEGGEGHSAPRKSPFRPAEGSRKIPPRVISSPSVRLESRGHPASPGQGGGAFLPFQSPVSSPAKAALRGQQDKEVRVQVSGKDLLWNKVSIHSSYSHGQLIAK